MTTCFLSFSSAGCDQRHTLDCLSCCLTLTLTHTRACISLGESLISLTETGNKKLSVTLMMKSHINSRSKHLGHNLPSFCSKWTAKVFYDHSSQQSHFSPQAQIKDCTKICQWWGSSFLSDSYTLLFVALCSIIVGLCVIHRLWFCRTKNELIF